MSLGEDRVRIKFNPSDNSLVSQIKQKSAELIDLCAAERKKGSRPVTAKSPEIERCYDEAMILYETAAMYAVKGATVG